MDWFHCNVCHLRQDTNYYITSCGHIICKNCITQDDCSVCKTACKCLPISDNLKPKEKIFFKSLEETVQKNIQSISKAWSFQKQQHDLHVTFYKEYITKVQNAYQEAMQKIKNQENELTAVKRENAELRSMVSNLKSSLSKSQSSSRPCTPRPIAITPPSQTVTPQNNLQQCAQTGSRSSSAESASYVRSYSGTGSRSTSSRANERTTPGSSSQGSPLSDNSISYRSSQVYMSSSPSTNSRSDVTRTDSSSIQIQTPNETNNFRTNSEAARDSFSTPYNNTDRLRALQLIFTPKMPGSLAFRK